MDQATMYDTPAALKTQIKHYKAHSERQAAKIAGLEGKVVDLEAKIAFLQEALVNERQKSNDHFTSSDVPLSLPGPSTSTASYTDSKFQVSQPVDAAAVSRFKASGAEKAVRPFTPVSLPSGSADDPVLLDDEDDEVLPRHHATPNSSPHEKPKPLDKRKASSSGNLTDLIPTWPAFDSPRKKPKVWVEVPRLHTTRSSRALLSKPVHKSPAIDASQKEPRAVPRGITPESVPSTRTPEHTIWSFEDRSVRAPSPALTPPRSPSRELTYVEIPKTISQAVSLPRADQSEAESSVSQVLGTPSAGSARQSVLTHLSGPSHTAVEEQGGQVVEEDSNRQSETHGVYRPSPSPASTTASSNRTESSPGRHPSNLRARLDTLATYQIPLISHKSLSLRISRQELGALDQDNQPNSLPARLCASRKVGHETLNMLMPSLAQNPALPCKPGAPGLLYRANDAYIWKGRVQTLFVKDTALRYQYMGEYNVVCALPLSPAEFREWDQNVKVVWARAICDMGKFSKIWARVGLRLKLGREPTEEEIRAAIQKRKGQKNGTKDYGQVPAIVKAYEDGDEVMGVWNMVCIGFKEDLLERIQDTAAKFKK